MTESLKALLAETESNNTFDIQSVSSTLKKTLENSFGYLYRLQRNVVRFKEFYFPKSISSETPAISAGDMYLDDKSRVCFNVDVDLVKQTARDKFYTSNLYKQEFTLDDINNNREIFERSILVMVDRKYYFDIKLVMLNGSVRVILPFKMSFLYQHNNDLIEHKTSVIIFDNTEYCTFVTNRGMLNKLSTDNKFYVTKSITGMKKFRDDGMYMMSISADGDTGSSLLYPCFLQDDGSLRVDFNSRIIDEINSISKDIICRLIFFIDMYELTSKSSGVIMADELPGTSDLSTNILIAERIDGVHYNMPVPTENMFVWKRISDGSEYNGDYEPFYQSGMNLYYPNMYTVSDPEMNVGDMYRVFYFYKKGYDLHYTDKFRYFYNYLKLKTKSSSYEEAVNKAYKKDIPGLSGEDIDGLTGTFRKLMNYKWVNPQFNTQDFVKNNSKISSYEYRVDRLKEFIADDSKILTDYVRHQNKTADTYYLYTQGIDLKKRVRRDTSNELSYTIQFDKDHYVFIFQNNEGSQYLNLRVWVDGLLVRRLIHENEYGIDYIYIPADQVTDDSYIEIDILHDCVFTGEFYLDNDNPSVDFVIPSDLVTPTKNDLIFIATDSEGNTSELSADDFEISRIRKGLDLSLTNAFGWVYSLKNVNSSDKLTGLAKEDRSITSMMDSLNLVPADELVEVPSGENKYTTMDIIRIKPNSEDAYFKHVTLKIRKNAYFEEFHYDRVGYPIIDLDGYSFKFSPEHIRIFKNGRLMPDSMYSIKTNFDWTRLQMLFEVGPGDDLVLDISPLASELIYHIELISEDVVQTYVDFTDDAKSILDGNIHVDVTDCAEPSAYESADYNVNITGRLKTSRTYYTIDLSKVLDKPFDIKMYDVFLNGRKLSERNVFPITDTMIQLKNVKSVWHLDIYERDRDEEYFGWTKNKTSYYYRIDDLLAESFVTDSEYEKILKDVIDMQIEDAGKLDLITPGPNDNSEKRNCIEDIDIDENLRHKIFYYEEILPARLGDPNEIQFNKAYIKSEYPEESEVWLVENMKPAVQINDPQTVKFPTNAIYLDPDIHADTATDVYMLGDYDDICEELIKEGKKGD